MASVVSRFSFLAFGSWSKELAQYHPLGDSSSEKGPLGKGEVGEGDAGEEGGGDGGAGAGSSDGSGGEREWATSDGRGDPGREEERLRRGGDQADSQSASDQALDAVMIITWQLLVEFKTCF